MRPKEDPIVNMNRPLWTTMERVFIVLAVMPVIFRIVRGPAVTPSQFWLRTEAITVGVVGYVILRILRSRSGNSLSKNS